MALVSPERNRCNCTSLRKASRRLSQHYDACLAPTGLKTTQYAILSEINRWANEAPTIRDLAHALVMDASTVGQNLRPLERSGLISIDPDLGDRRRRNVRLTREGASAFATARPHWEKAQAQFESRFGVADALALRGMLKKIIADEGLTPPE